MPVQVLVRILVVIFMRAVMVPGIFMFTLYVNDPGIRRGGEIKNGNCQQNERKKFFHYYLVPVSRIVLNTLWDVKKFSARPFAGARPMKKDYLSLPASWRKF
jgi:hypothetical protein